MINIAVFASGAGTNAAKIIGKFKNHLLARVCLVVSSNPGARVIEIAEKEKVPLLLIEKERFANGDSYLPLFAEHKIDFIVLAGFLWKIPSRLIDTYPQRIVNIHPALLPNYGGKGMYGSRVHQAVIDNKEGVSGITIHFVDDLYDHGDTIFQASCVVHPGDTPEALAARVTALEHKHYSVVVEGLIKRIVEQQTNVLN